MVQQRDRSGLNHKVYNYDGVKIEILPYFLYEVCIYKYWKSGFCMLGSRFFKSDTLLNIKHNHKFKRYDEYIIEKEVTLIGAPYQFIRENKLSEYKSNIKSKKPRRK